ncbi:MAG: DNA repair protein RecN [Gammaproteobacteria bacterium]|nr:DNA repair protein RecN [Gammaproteobacteria bacterium]
MLTTIAIKDFALIDRLNLDLSQGMTTITGETGAGKSIVIDALGLALGERADASMIRYGSAKADITASFSLNECSSAISWLKEHDLDDEFECIVRRVIAKEGRSKCYINGRPANLNMLKDLGDFLVDIHGQHAHQSLLRPNYQLSLIDELLNDKEVLEQTAVLAKQYQKELKRYNELKQTSDQRSERIELLQYQLDELEALHLSKDSISQLESEHARGNNLQELISACEQANDQLFDQEPGVYGALAHFSEQFNRLSAKDAQLTSVSELFANATALLEELKSELRHYQDSLDVDPDNLEELNQQLSTLFDLSRKHQCDLEELPNTEVSIRDELEKLSAASSDLTELQSSLEKIKAQYNDTANKLSLARQKAARQLSKKVTECMQSLGMEGGKFDVIFNPLNERISTTGIDAVDFQVTANPGQPMQTLGKVASGGELSRISLAIQVITAEKKVTPTLIFDEVDVGIGGQTADRVGRMLSSLAEHAQIICVTHQPQVAAKGQQQLRAVKQKHKNSTETAMQHLSGEQRIEEIARMVGGQSITELTLSHAKELLEVS